MSCIRWLGPCVLTGVLASGCGTYMEAKSNIAPGGQLNRDIVSARTDLAVAKRQQADLRDAKLQRDREIERTEKRIHAVQTELARYDADLSSALQTQRLTRARHDDLKRQLSSIRAEVAALELQNGSDRMQAPDPKAQAEKETRLVALEQRRRDLEASITALLKR